ncbi:MAG: NAD(P)/FAD-dependent oxidoreductase [Flavobacteriaceae bacterium]|nr:NAD(P)/FAD-dependent oxidoreductase [Flavobacteriaceae bacterium]
MQQEFQIQVPPKVAQNQAQLKQLIAKKVNIKVDEIKHIEILKRSIDARQKNIKINLRINAFIKEDFIEKSIELPHYDDVSNAKEVIIIGAGPAGLFAALKLIEKGFKPIVLERGKNVKERRRDLAAITKLHLVDEDSNYCFGEGGAGTYSDGKLYTRSKKRGDVNQILDLLIAHGATKNIAVDAHPHIGTNKLPQIIQTIRKTILKYGGVVQFNTRVIDILIKNSEVNGVQTQNGDIINSNKVILATGHSARDIFELLVRKGIKIEAKPFALGVRVEHSQQLIDSIQYHCETRSEYLPPAPYSVVKQVNNRGVYSFCMCPGGVIAPCATAPGEVVTNGWSPSKRDQPTSNSGIVVELKLEDLASFQDKGSLAGVEFQKQIEQKAWLLAGRTQKVPAQRLVDFTKGKLSDNIPKTSYMPGTTSVELGIILPNFIHQTLQEGFKQFEKSMKGYLTNEAIVHAPESRTSSPIRIPRDHKTLEHIQVKGLYPCGEGAGYAGGIISAAIDGEKCAEQISLAYK